MKLSSDNETLAENKALILYILDKVNKPIGNTVLLKLVLLVNNMNYFYFQQFLLDLIENKYILSYQNGKETFYELTDEGRNALRLVEDLIPGYFKFKVDNNCKDDLQNIENELSITSDFIPHNETDYSVKCAITENNKTVFEITVSATSREQAKFIANNWKKNADKIYPQILKIITSTSK